MSPPIASTNATSVSKATRAGTSTQQNIASTPCAHAVATEKRVANRANIVARPVGHARSLFCASEAARCPLSTGVERAHKVRLRWMSGTPPRPLEVTPVEKRLWMAERGHAAVAAASRFSGTLPCGPYHVVVHARDDRGPGSGAHRAAETRVPQVR